VKPCALDDVEANATEAKYHHIGPRLYLGCVDDGSNPGGNATADVADFVQRCIGANFGDGDFRQYSEVREGAAAHVMQDRCAIDGEA
jgi:hypothetical protein